MRPVRFNCPSCNKRLGAPLRLSGRTGRCPRCGAVVVVPDPLAEVASPPSLAPDQTDYDFRAEPLPEELPVPAATATASVPTRELTGRRQGKFEALVTKGILTRDQLEDARRMSRGANTTLEQILEVDFKVDRGEEEQTPTVEVETDDVDENDSVVVKMVNQLILDAQELQASDIHIETYARRPIVIRYRIDGDCVQKASFPKKFARAIVSRIKIMSGLDIAEHRRPQDGKIRFKMTPTSTEELRVATYPTTEGLEDVVMRLLGSAVAMPVMQLGLSARTEELLLKLIKRPHGLIFVVGPTGSGKTTTLHSLMGHINPGDRKILTAEDPVEITQYGLRQLQVNPKIGLTFATAMRSFLRADPDVIMVGECRDFETASTAIEASLTGHLVMSTLHTNNAPETVTRLLDMGLDPYAFADSLIAVLAQRLVRGLCQGCRIEYEPAAAEWTALGEEYGRSAEPLPTSPPNGTLLFRRGTGCGKCRGTGYKGRFGIHELLVSSEEIRTAIHRKRPAARIRALAISQGMHTLKQDGIGKVLEGLTDLEQVVAASGY